MTTQRRALLAHFGNGFGIGGYFTESDRITGRIYSQGNEMPTFVLFAYWKCTQYLYQRAVHVVAPYFVKRG